MKKNLHTLPLPILGRGRWSVVLCPPRPRPLNPLPLRKRPGTPNVSMFNFFSSAQVVLLLMKNVYIVEHDKPPEVIQRKQVVITWAYGLMRCCQRSIWFCRSICLPEFPPPAYPGCPGPPRSPPFQLQQFTKTYIHTRAPLKVTFYCVPLKLN